MDEYKYIGKEMILDVIKARGRYLGDAEIMNSMDKTALDQIEGYKKALDSIAEDVENISPVNVQPVDRWISIEERLPIECGPVLCYARSTTGEGNFRILGALRNGEFWFLQVDGTQLSFPNLCLEVTHWMPLPEPPKDGDTQ